MNSIFKTFVLSLMIIANTHFAYAQTAAILPPAKTTFFDQNGKPLASGKVYSYIPGTSTLKTTWQDAGETISNTNPVTLDAAGRGLILGSGPYRQVVKDKNGNTIWDQVTAASGSSGGGGGTGDGTAVGTVMAWAGMVAPTNYAFAYGQELSRTTFSALLTNITNVFAVTCTSGNPTLTGMTDTTQLNVGAAVEGACIAASSTIVSKTSNSVTLNNNALVSVTINATFFNYGNGNATTTFNVPDLRGYNIIGRCNMGGASCSNLNATYFGADPSSTGTKAGSQSTTLVTANLPAQTPSGTNAITGTDLVQVNGISNQSLGGAGVGFGWSNVPTIKAASALVSATFTGTAFAGQTSTAFSRVQPGITLNYIIKTVPDTAGGGGGGATTCGGLSDAGTACTANTGTSGHTLPFLDGVNTFAGRTLVAAAGGSTAGFNIIPGGVPATPANGDMWVTATGLFVRVNGVTVGPLGTSSGVAVGATTVAGATNANVLFNNAGVLGQYPITGTGTVVMATSPTMSGPTFTGTITATGLVKNTDLANSTMTINGTVCTLGSSCAPAATATSITTGTTQTLGGTNTRVLFNNAGVLGEYAITGTGSVVMSVAPTITGHPTIETVTSTGATGTGNLMFSASPTITGTLGGTNVIANSSLQQMAATAIKGNPTNATANPTDFTIQGLTARGAPNASTDRILIWDSAAGDLKYVTPAQIASSATAGVSSIDATTGAFTTNNTKGIKTSGTILETIFTQLGTGAVSQDLVSKTQQYGPTPQDFGASGTSVATTGTISSGASSLTLNAALDFKNGQGIIIQHAGTANSVNQPTSLAVTAQGTTGATTYSYQIAAFSTTGSMTAAVTAVTIANGNATLTSTNKNHLTWSAPVGGTTPAGYAVYGKTTGTKTLLALVPVGTTTWDDTGIATIVTPNWAGTNPSVSATANWLLTSILSGAGTVNLSLNNTASTTATGLYTGHDDTAALNRWLTALSNGLKVGYYPSGIYSFATCLNTVAGGGWGIIGGGAGNTNMQYTGSDITCDLMKIGTQVVANLDYGWIARGFTITSITKMGAGVALNLLFQDNYLIDNVDFEGLNLGNSQSFLFNGLYVNGSNYGSYINSSMHTSNDCLQMQSVSGLLINNVRQIFCGQATHIAGNNGGIYLGYVEIFGAVNGVLVDNALHSNANLQIYQSQHTIIDNCTSNGVYLGDTPGAPNEAFHLYVMGGWAASTLNGGTNFNIVGWKSGVVSFVGAQIVSGSASGVNINDSTTVIRIDGSTNIQNNTGWGVLGSVSTNNVYSDALPIGNGSGAYHSNTHVEGSGNPSYRKHASGYVDIFGTNTGGASSDLAVSFPTGSCPNNLLSLNGNVVSSGASGTQAVSVAFSSQTTSGFTGQVRLIGAGSVAFTASNYMWKALCN